MSLWKHKNLFLLAFGILFGIFLYNYQPFHNFLISLKEYGYIGAFIAGILYDSTLTVSTSIVMLLIFSEEFQLWTLLLVTTAGAVIGDYLVWRFVKGFISTDIQPIVEEVQKEIGYRRVKLIKKLFKTRYVHWTLPIIAAFLIGSPFPNEIAWGLLGVSRLKTIQVLAISFVFNCLGLAGVLGVANLIRA